MEIQVCGTSLSCAGATEPSPRAVSDGVELLEATTRSEDHTLTQNEPCERSCEHGNEQGDFPHSPTRSLSSESPVASTRSRWQTLYPSSTYDTCSNNDRLASCYEDNSFGTSSTPPPFLSYNLHGCTSSPYDGDPLETSVDAELQDWFQSVQSAADEEAQAVLSSWSKSRKFVNPDRDDCQSGLSPIPLGKNWCKTIPGNLSNMIDDGCRLSCKDIRDNASAYEENILRDSDVAAIKESLLQNVLDRVQTENFSGCHDQQLSLDFPQPTERTHRASMAESKGDPCLSKIDQYTDDFESNVFSLDDLTSRSRRRCKADSIDSSTHDAAQEKERGRRIHRNGSMVATDSKPPKLFTKTTSVTETVAKIATSETDNNQRVKFTSLVKKNRLALMRRCFLGMSEFSAMEKRKRNQATDHIRLKHMRVPRMMLRKWRELASSNIQQEERIVKARNWKRMRRIFSNWMDFVIKSSLNAKHVEHQQILKCKADVMCRWKRSVRILVTQRQQALETLQREEALRLETKVCQWHRHNVLTSCILGWRAVAQTALDQKTLNERKQRRKTQIETLLNRLSNDKLGDRKSAVLDSGSKEAVTRLQKAIPSNGSKFLGQSIDANVMALRNPSDQNFSKWKTNGKSSGSGHPDNARSPCSNISGRFANGTNKAIQPTKNLSKAKGHTGTSGKTQQCSGAKSDAEVMAATMERRRQERIERRKELHNRYLEKKRAEEEMLRLEEIRKQEEFQRSLDQEKQRRINEQAEKRRAFELRKEAWRLAGLHSRFSSMKRGIAAWKSHLEFVHLQRQKAELFHRDQTEHKVLKVWNHFWREQKKLRQEEEMRKLGRAEEFRQAHIVGDAFRDWRRVANETKQSDDSLCLQHARCHTRRRIMRRWRERAKMERLRSWNAARSAGFFVRRFHLRRSLDAWRTGTVEAAEERRRDEDVAARWVEVRRWLQSPTED